MIGPATVGPNTLLAMWGKLKDVAARPWFDRALAIVGLALLVAAVVRIEPKDWLARGLLLIVAGVLIKMLIEGRARKPKTPRLSLDATTGASSTTSRDGKRVGDVNVILFLRNAEDAGEARHVTVTIVTLAAKCFHLHPTSRGEASDNLLDDEHTIVWQRAAVGPGGQADLTVKSDQFAFDDDEVSAQIRITAEGIDPWEGSLTARVSRHDGLNAEFETMIADKDETWVGRTHRPKDV